jgi:SAM-dependent methyltransferase
MTSTIPGMSNHATQVYALGADEEETARLRRQSDELRPEAEALLARVGLRPGQAAIDLGCGPSGILGLLAAAVSRSGKVTGLDADPAHVAAARQYAATAQLGCVSVLSGDGHPGPSAQPPPGHPRPRPSGRRRARGPRPGRPRSPGRPRVLMMPHLFVSALARKPR